MNLQIMEFENAILNFCNQSSLPSEVKRLVFLEILQKVEEKAYKDIDREMLQRQKEQQKEHKTVEVNSSGEVVEKADEQSLSENSVGELSE